MSIVKPTIHTAYVIDFDWWRKTQNDWHVHLRSALCAEHQEAFAEMDSNQMIDWVDPVTAEVRQVDGLQHALITHCSQQPDFISEYSPLVDSLFRLFLANGNAPMTPEEMSERLPNHSAEKILRTLSGQVQKGLRPYVK
jgi:hypothetical protein